MNNLCPETLLYFVNEKKNSISHQTQTKSKMWKVKKHNILDVGDKCWKHHKRVLNLVLGWKERFILKRAVKLSRPSYCVMSKAG